jgi:paraquat-inducible protein B
VDFRLTAEGLVLDTQSLVSVLVGGIAFDTPNNLLPGGPVDEEHRFTLFPNRTASVQPPTEKKTRYLLFFSGSVRGLTIGAPVEFHGIKIGEVLDLELEYHTELGDFLIPVLIEIESGRMTIVGPELDDNASEAAVDQLVVQGLRGQLKSGSLITGQLYVDLDFHPDAPAAEIDRSGRYPVLPTVPAPLEAITASVRNILGEIERLPLEEIASDLRDAVRGIKRVVDSEALIQAIEALNETLQETRRFTAGLNQETAPALNTALRQSETTLASADNLFSPESALYRELKKLLRELSAAARSIRVMTDYLERHPDALIYGKGRRR